MASITKPFDHEAVLSFLNVILPSIRSPGDNVVTECESGRTAGVSEKL